MSEKETYGANVNWGVMHPLPEGLKDVAGLTDYKLFPKLMEEFEYRVIPISNGNFALAVMEIEKATPSVGTAMAAVFDWIERNEKSNPPVAKELLGILRDLGHCACTTKFGCVVCGGK